jgi:hypothetical protein
MYFKPMGGQNQELKEYLGKDFEKRTFTFLPKHCLNINTTSFYSLIKLAGGVSEVVFN